MRPRELILDGFRSYSGATTISWEERSLVGIVGPIGSGKSSILDGISFALYGRTPRLGTETRGLINQRRSEGKVSLTFAVAGQEWRVVRALRRKGQSAHVLYRVDDGGEEEVTDKAREVTERITDLLGLDYDAFRRSILLAQGQFAEFLDATPSDRNGVLKGVFGFERLDAMRDAARTRRDEAAAKLTALARLRQQAEQDGKDLVTATGERGSAAALVKRLEAAREPVDRTATALAAVGEERAGLLSERQQMMTLAERIPEREQTEALLDTLDQARSQIAAAEAEAARAALAEEAAGKALEAGNQATGGRELLARAGALLARYEEQRRSAARAVEAAAAATLASAEAALAAEEAKVRAAAAAADHGAAVEALQSAAAGLIGSEAALHEATHRDLAAGLRQGLHDGDTCPVCEQEIPAVPPSADSGLAAAQAAHQKAQAAVERARSAEGAAARAAASLEAAARAADDEQARAGKATGAAAAASVEAASGAEGTMAEAHAMLGDDGDPAGVIAERQAVLDEADRAVAEARSDASEAASALAKARAGAEQSASAVERLLTRLADLAGRLALDDLALSTAPDDLRAALRALSEAWKARTHQIDTRLPEIDESAAVHQAELDRALATAGLEAGADLSAAIAAAREELAALEARVADLTRRLEDLTLLEAEQAESVAAHDRYQRLFDDLAPAKFPTFVLDDRRRALAALGSERFEHLSAGRYRFTDDGVFDVIDLAAADLTRSAASLSGGETFLASLALALALAEIVAREGGRLDSFFLDEGFGSLDAEHIELAMAGIERLVTENPDRLIVLVSHVAGLQERVEDLIVLTKDGVTGDTTVRSGASAVG